MKEKPCIHCKEVKPLSEYYAHAKMVDGTLGICKECHKARMKIRALTNPKVQEYARKRAKRPDVKQRLRTNSDRWRQKHPEAYKAQSAVSNAVRSGKLKKLPCAICGTDKNIHAHHENYSKPLDVKWLCAKCHHRLHAAFPKLGGHYEASA